VGQGDNPLAASGLASVLVLIFYFWTLAFGWHPLIAVPKISALSPIVMAELYLRLILWNVPDHTAFENRPEKCR
jgi:hypothetical protein